MTKRFGSVVAVDDLSFSVHPGMVTGFLGPNGAGKTTTLRMLVGLVTPTSGSALVNGVRYKDLANPSSAVGAVLEASGFHPARTARNHLRTIATASGIELSKVDEVLELVGLSADARRNVGGYSMGMRQRLELARALLGDPQILILDEPANGLDPQGIAWIRGFLRWFASLGRVVLISSHLLAEAAQTVDEVVILAKGRLVGQGPLREMLAGATTTVRVRSPDAQRLATVLRSAGVESSRVRLEGPDLVVAEGTKAEVVGPLIAENRIVVYEMTSSGESLEQLFFDMTEGAHMGPVPSDARGWQSPSQEAERPMTSSHLPPPPPPSAPPLPPPPPSAPPLPPPPPPATPLPPATPSPSASPESSSQQSDPRESTPPAAPPPLSRSTPGASPPAPAGSGDPGEAR